MTLAIYINEITAHGDFYGDSAVEAGCDAILRKPIDLKKLGGIISLYLNP